MIRDQMQYQDAPKYIRRLLFWSPISDHGHPDQIRIFRRMSKTPPFSPWGRGSCEIRMDQTPRNAEQRNSGQCTFYPTFVPSCLDSPLTMLLTLGDLPGKSLESIQKILPFATVSAVFLRSWRLWKFTIMPIWWPNEPKLLPYWKPVIGKLWWAWNQYQANFGGWCHFPRYCRSHMGIYKQFREALQRRTVRSGPCGSLKGIIYEQ